MDLSYSYQLSIGVIIVVLFVAELFVLKKLYQA